MTPEQAYVRAALNGILDQSRGRYRTGALVLTCAPTPGEGDSRLVHAVLMGEVTLEAAVDLTQLSKRLRQIADDIDAEMGRRN